MNGLPDPAASRAVLIGVHSYHLLDDLPAVAFNLTGLRQVLTDPTLWGLPSEHCTVLTQPENPRQVLDRLRDVAIQATDTLVVYYAGHGLADPYTEELCLTLPDSDPALAYTTLRYEDVRRLVVDPAVRSQRKVVILDCCYSGRALLGGMSAGEQVADQAVVQGTYLLTASAETRKALAPPGERYTAFTGELIETLSKGVPHGPELLDLDTVYRRVHAALAAKARPLPQARNRNTGGLIALARNVARSPRPVEPPQSVGRPQSAGTLSDGVPVREVHAGVSRLAELIGRTLGPAGSLVILGPTTTADPARICEVLSVEGHAATLGANLVRHLVRRMRDEWSDGAATAVVMAAAMMSSAVDAVTEGVNPARLSAELARLAEAVGSALRDSAVDLDSKEQVAEVVHTATGDRAVGEVLAEALDKIGREGVIAVQPLDASGLELELREGMHLPASERQSPGDFPTPIVDDVRVVLGSDHPPFDDGQPVLTVVVHGTGVRVSLADRQVDLPVPDPAGVFEDIAVLVGAARTPPHGRAVRAAVSRAGLYLEAEPAADDMIERVNHIRERLNSARTDAEREDLQLRLARLVGGVAYLWVGHLPGESAEETRARRELIVRARDVLRPLVDGGRVAGGGVALRDAGRALARSTDGPAKSVLLSGLQAPSVRILSNSGYPPDGGGLDVLTGQTGPMLDLGVVDVARVVGGALTAAVATTRQFLALA